MFWIIIKIILFINIYDNSYLYNLNFFSVLFMKMCYFVVGFCIFFINWDGDWYDSGMGEIWMSECIKFVIFGWDVLVFIIFFILWLCVISNDIGFYLLFKYIFKFLVGLKYFLNLIWMNVGCFFI